MEWTLKSEFWFNVTFVCRKKAEKVYLVGDFNGWQADKHEMNVCDEGFQLTLSLSEGFYHYKFIVDGAYVRDKDNPHTGGNNNNKNNNNSIMFVHMDPGVYGLRDQCPPVRVEGDSARFFTHDISVPPSISSRGLLQRLVFVYVPRSYIGGDKHYPVVYAHDGQNLFSTPGDQGGPAWGGWYLDAKLDHWWSTGTLPEFILVAIPNSDYVCIGNRQLELTASDFSSHPQEPYAQYVTDVVKPFVDANYRTLSDAANTFTLGSSLGGVVSFLLPLLQPDVFSCGICLSPALWFVDDKDQTCYSLIDLCPTPARCRLYIDSGDGDGDNYHYVRDMADRMAGRGWESGRDFVYHLDHSRDSAPLGVTHSEAVWRERVLTGLKFAFDIK